MPTPGQPELSVIFVSYRSAGLLERSLRSLCSTLQASEGSIEVIIVGNDPEERERLEALSGIFPVSVIVATENLGFGAAANRAAGQASGEFLLFLNPDTEHLHGSFDLPARFFRSHPEVGVLGARLVDGFGNPEPWSVGYPANLLRILIGKLKPSFLRKYWEYDYAVSVGWVSGGALFVRSALFRDLGGFDEGFFLYFEDMDFCIRSRKRGYRTVFHPGISFLHRGGASFRSHEEQKSAYYGAQDRYFNKHRPGWEAALLRRLRSRIMMV
ncbi:MAG: glycosyltransferase [Candidatus Moranbacteria bacterium]|nr:glycosyltransferase [Candidatus Moranbacteria bacterium]